jgi:hypothetical protein
MIKILLLDLNCQVIAQVEGPDEISATSYANIMMNELNLKKVTFKKTDDVISFWVVKK